MGLVSVHIQGLESTREMFRKLFWVTLNLYDNTPEMAVANIVTTPTHAWMKEGTYLRKDACDLINGIIAYGRNCNEVDPAITNE